MKSVHTQKSIYLFIYANGSHTILQLLFGTQQGILAILAYQNN